MNFVSPIPTGKVTKLAKEFCFRLTKVMADNIVTIRPAECRLAELFRMFYMAERGCHTVSPNSIWRSDSMVVAPRSWSALVSEFVPGARLALHLPIPGLLRLRRPRR